MVNTRKQSFDNASTLSSTNPIDYIKLAYIADVMEDSHELPTYPNGETQLFMLSISGNQVFMTFNNFSCVARIWTKPDAPIRVIKPFRQLWTELGQL